MVEKTEDRPELLLPKEVAPMLRVSLANVYELVRRKDITGVWIGGSLRIPRGPLERKLAGGDAA